MKADEKSDNPSLLAKRLLLDRGININAVSWILAFSSILKHPSFCTLHSL